MAKKKEKLTPIPRPGKRRPAVAGDQVQAPAPAAEPDLSRITPSLRPLAQPIAGLAFDPNNARTHGEENLDAIRVSLEAYGQRKPIVVNRRTGHVEAGNGTLAAALALDWQYLAVVEVDDDPATAAGFAIADNRSAELAGWDQKALDKLMRECETGKDPRLDKMLAGLAKEKGIAATEGNAASAKRQADVEDVEDIYAILVRCGDEAEQKAVLEELARHELDVRAMVVEGMKKQGEEPPSVELPAGEVQIERKTVVRRSPRVMQLEGMFDIPPTKVCKESWRLQIELDRPWNIGLIVGPSGSGKSTVARELFGDYLVGDWPWSEDKALVDDFPANMGIAEITGLLSSVGFSSPPGWLKPFRVLSNGEQFRVMMARTMAESPALAVVDEFTSVVDRTVARIGSSAIAKAVRAGQRKLIVASCHGDIEEWLQPDWVVQMPGGALAWSSLRRRPEIQLRVHRASRQAWEIFRRHHYLNHDLASAARCFVGEIDGRLAAFAAVLHNPGKQRHFWREHRMVCLPDFQGVGIGNAMSETVAAAFASTGKPYRSITSHPGMIAHRLRSPRWACARPPSLGGAGMSKSAKYPSAMAMRASLRFTASFQYAGAPDHEAAKALGIVDGQAGFFPKKTCAANQRPA